jgi:hypothetical protein
MDKPSKAGTEVSLQVEKTLVVVDAFEQLDLCGSYRMRASSTRKRARDPQLSPDIVRALAIRSRSLVSASWASITEADAEAFAELKREVSHGEARCSRTRQKRRKRARRRHARPGAGLRGPLSEPGCRAARPWPQGLR